MCGIIGSINYYLPDEAVQSIKHRGPDEFGSEEAIINNHVVRLFHHRLSILDQSANGCQPMMSSDGHGIIIFNGKVYNHAELRNQLPDIQFRGHSDTETLVNLFRSGCTEELLARLNGIFAFAYIDIPGEKIYLARDRFGVKPLYYHFTEDEVIFSSEIRPIIDRIGQLISTNSITSALELRHVPAPSTLFKTIYKVEPGQLIEITLGDKLSITKGFFGNMPQAKRRGVTTRQQLVKEYGQLLEKAVERQLLSDVEVGVFLSGGVDSSLIAAIAKSKMKNLKAFSVGYDNKKPDERRNASITAEYLNLDHYSAEVKFEHFISHFQHIVNIVEEPLDSGSFFSMYTLAELASSKVKVVLSGQGPDKPLRGYTRALPTIDYLSNAKAFPGVFRFLYKYLDSRTKLPENRLKYTDKITMHFSLECRVPMLDNDLVEFIESVPGKNKSGLRNSKNIHRLFAKEYLPSDIVRNKLAFSAPSKTFLKDHSKEIRQWFIDNDDKLFWRVFDKRKILQLVDEHARVGNRDKELTLIMSTLFLTAKKKSPYLIQQESSN